MKDKPPAHPPIFGLNCHGYNGRHTTVKNSRDDHGCEDRPGNRLARLPDFLTQRRDTTIARIGDKHQSGRMERSRSILREKKASDAFASYPPRWAGRRRQRLPNAISVIATMQMFTVLERRIPSRTIDVRATTIPIASSSPGRQGKSKRRARSAIYPRRPPMRPSPPRRFWRSETSTPAVNPSRGVKYW